MSCSAGTFDVGCPECGEPITILIEAEAVQRQVLPDLASKGALTILLGVNQVALDQELARHYLAGCDGA